MPRLRPLRGALFAGALLAVLAPAAPAQGFRAAATKDGVDAWVAGDSGAVWRSLDGGATWAPRALGGKPLRAAAARGFTVLLAGDSGQVWRSADNGGTWTLRTSPALAAVRALALPEAGRAYLAGDGGMILRSDDGGDTWSPQPSGTTARLNALAFTDADHGWAAGAAGTLLRTGDGGATWTPVPLGTGVELFAVAASGAHVWVGGAEAGCWRSTNAGASFAWFDLGMDLLAEVSALALSGGDTVWVAGGGGFVRRSDDGGATWTWAVHPLHGPVGGIAFANGRGIVALRPARIAARWTAGDDTLRLPAGATVARSWTRQLVSSGASIRGNTLAVNPLLRSTLWAVIGSAMHRSRDDGETWTAAGTVGGQNRANAFLISPKDTNVFLMASVSTTGQRTILRSVNGGGSWVPRHSHVFGEYGVPIEQDPDRPDTLLFGGDNDVLQRSVDGGVTWTDWGETKFRSPCDLAIAPGEPDRVVVADGVTSLGLGKLWRSTDAGANFVLRDSVSGSEVPMLGSSRQRNQTVFGMCWSATGAKFSADGGLTWAEVADLNRPGQDVAATWGVDVARDDPNVVLAGAYSGATSYLSLDGGVTFAPIPLSGSNYGLLLRDRGSLFALQSGGVYKLRATYAYAPAAGAQALAVTAPNGGETWDAGSVHEVTWTAANVATARIEWRPDAASAWQLVAEVDGHLGAYPWTVPPVPTTTAELRVLDAWDGGPLDAANAPFTITAVLAVGDERPVAPALAPVAPSPLLAGARARVSFDLPRAAHVELELFDVTGQRVRTLAARAFEPGRHTLSLDTSALRAGVYFVRLRTPAFTASRRLLILR